MIFNMGQEAPSTSPLESDPYHEDRLDALRGLDKHALYAIYAGLSRMNQGDQDLRKQLGIEVGRDERRMTGEQIGELAYQILKEQADSRRSDAN